MLEQIALFRSTPILRASRFLTTLGHTYRQNNTLTANSGGMCVVRNSLNDGGATKEGDADGKGGKKDVTKANGAKDAEPVFEIVEETVEYERYMSLYNRKVRFPNAALGTDDQKDAVYEFDVIGHPKSSFCFCVALPFHPPEAGKDWREGEITMIREYAQGPNEMVYGLPAGAFHSGKHATAEECARAELSEEVRIMYVLQMYGVYTFIISC